MILALLLAAQSQSVAVLEFRDKVPPEQRIDAAYLSDQVRAEVKTRLPQSRVITRENMLVLLKSNGKTLEDCEGECEVETGRRIGADLVVSGELLKFGTQYKLNMKLHDTRSGELLSGTVASGANADELDRALRPAVDKLLAALGPQVQPERRAEQRASSPPPLQREVRRPSSKFGVSVTAGYGSSSAASGFAWGFGAEFLLHLAGPLYVGPFADLSFLPSTGSNDTGLLAGGVAHLDLGEVALFGGGGYSDLSDNGGTGYGLLGGATYGIWVLQVAWRHGTADVISGVSTVKQTTNVTSVQGGLSIIF